jgi:hypothetical protein
MIISLPSPISRPRIVSKVEVFSITDESAAKRVSAVVSIESEGTRTLTLWEGDAYDEVGQWTDADAAARVLELIEELFSHE